MQFIASSREGAISTSIGRNHELFKSVETTEEEIVKASKIPGVSSAPKLQPIEKI